MRQRCFSRGVPAPPVADCGLGDSSGIHAIWVQTCCSHFPSLQKEAQKCVRANEHVLAASAASRIWNVRAMGSSSATTGEVTLDFETAEVVEPSGTRTDLWKLYEKRGRDPWPVVAWLDPQQ